LKKQKCVGKKLKNIAPNLDIGEHFVRITIQNKNYTNIKEAPKGASTNETMKKIK